MPNNISEKTDSFVNTRIKGKKTVYFRIKRILDIVISLVAMLIAAIPMILIGLIVRVESPGPAIYTQERVGKCGKPFRIYKFRTMYVNSDSMIQNFTPEQRAEWEKNFKLEHDPRVTRIGKFLRKSSMDELPQLWNVLKGELSLVGPRPVLEEEAARYGDERDVFLSVTPGLTGYWQAYARSSCTYEERMQMELHYARNANFLWDIRILFATVGSVLTGRGAK